MNDRPDVGETVVAGYADAFKAIHGERARAYAAVRAVQLSAAGDQAGHQRMLQIVGLIEREAARRAA